MLLAILLDWGITDKMKAIFIWNAPIKVFAIVNLDCVNVSMDILAVHASVNLALTIALDMAFA
jgi:hypothetical protein